MLDVNIKDSSHFKQNVTHKLDKWGYEYLYTSKQVSITKIPKTAEEKLREILIRELRLDTQINPYAFSCFLAAFQDIPHFDSMPWTVRAEVFRDEYGIEVTDRTLRNWCSRLLEREFIYKDTCGSQWKSEEINGCVVRTPVAEGDEKMLAYFAERKKLLEEEKKEAIRCGIPEREAFGRAYQTMVRELWNKYHCYYYRCKNFTLTAFDPDQENTLYEIYELTQEIIQKQNSGGKNDSE